MIRYSLVGILIVFGLAFAISTPITSQDDDLPSCNLTQFNSLEDIMEDAAELQRELEQATTVSDLGDYGRKYIQFRDELWDNVPYCTEGVETALTLTIQYGDIIPYLLFGNLDEPRGVSIFEASVENAIERIEELENRLDELVQIDNARNRRVLFKVISDGNVNIRSCAGTSCNPPVGTSKRGDVFEVVAQKTGNGGEWYEIKYGDGTAYMAGWLTIRTSSATATARASVVRATATVAATATPRLAVFETGQFNQMHGTNTTCSVIAERNPSAAENLLSIGGQRRGSVRIYLIRPDGTELHGRGERRIEYLGESARLFTLRPSARLTPGTYTYIVRMDSRDYRARWRVRNQGYYAIVFTCDPR